MITATPDSSLTTDRLAAEIARFQGELGQASSWRYREKYVDRGALLDPFYILEVRAPAGDDGDDLMDEPLFATRAPALAIKHITRHGRPGDADYWRTIDSAGARVRFDRFFEMYRGGYLEPPGFRDEHDGARRGHARLEGKRFVFRLQSPARTVVGLGPATHAGGGAVYAVVKRDGQPLASTDIELRLSDGGIIKRRSDDQGRFWIARVPAGTHTLRVPGHALTAEITAEPFGCVRGQVTAQGAGAAGVRVELTAPDGEVFAAAADDGGAFHVGSVPAFPFIVRIPSFLFTATISVRAEAEIAITLRDGYGEPLATEVVLLRDQVEVARQTSSVAGAARFTGLVAGRYTVTVPGRRLYATRVRPGELRGTLTGVPGPIELELVADGAVVAATRSDAEGCFAFAGVAPGGYALRAGDLLLRRRSGS